jgi:pentatricopeptide repeat protein
VLFDGMLRRDKIDVKPNVHTFTAFIDGLNYSEFETPGSLKEEKKIITEMFKVLEVMQAVNVKPTTATFNAILKRVSVLFSSNSSVKNKRVDDYARVVIDEVFKKMEEAECSPNLITYNTLIDASVASDRPNDAYEWLSRLAESGLKPDQYTYATLLKFFALRRDASGTKWVLAEIDRLRVRVDVRVYNAAFNALAKSGEIDETVDLIRELESTTGVSPDAASYLVIIDAYAADSKIEDAVRVYETFCRGESEENAAKTDARTRSRMVKILCDSKKTNASLFRDADGWIERIIEEDSVSEDERIQLRQATAQYLTTKSSNTAANRQKKMLSSSLSSSSQQQKTPRVVIREAVLLPRDNDANVGSRDEGMYAMYSMEKEDDSDEIKLTKTNVPCDTDQTFKWDRGVEMWKFWLGIPNRYYRDANSPFTDEDEENPLSGSGNGPVEV